MNYPGCRPLSEEEVVRLIDAFTGRYRARDVALVVLGSHTGFRISELLSIQVNQIWTGTEVVKEVQVAKGFMKGKKMSRTMPLHEKAREAIWALLQSSRMWHPLFHEWPLFHAQGCQKRLSTRQAYDIIVNAAERAGLDTKRIGTHSLRKSFAKRLWTGRYVNMDPARMARLLGHQNWSNTLRYLEFADELNAAVLA